MWFLESIKGIILGFVTLIAGIFGFSYLKTKKENEELQKENSVLKENQQSYQEKNKIDTLTKQTEDNIKQEEKILNKKQNKEKENVEQKINQSKQGKIYEVEL